MAAVQGIGGIFIYSNDAARLADWYQRVLGIALEPHPDGGKYFRVFLTRDAATSMLRENPVFAIYQANTRLPKEGRGFMLNLRVDDLTAYLEQLRTQGVQIESAILEWVHGKHAWILDLDGNRVELYEEIVPNQEA